jgi:cytochrome oxidase Cu insertion factor (SCO1/SenC/PrrC family)
MPGMNSGLNINDARVVSAFGRTLLHQGLIAVLLFATLGIIWVTARAWLSQPTGPTQPTESSEPAGPAPTIASAPTQPAEPLARQLLRIGFGLIWVFDGILQAQPKMALGLPSQVIEPTAASSPHWVQTMINWAGTNWSYHPLQAAAAAVWIQVGIGVWLLASSKGRLSRLAGVASVGWSLVVWVFGESFGGVFAPGLTWLFGAPGAALIYAIATGLIALPDRAWTTRTLGRALLGSTGVFLLGMAVLQAWPGRGFWPGTAHGQAGPLADMAGSMAQLSQPRFLANLASDFTSLDQAHGFAVNLVAVTALVVIGGAFTLSFTKAPEQFRIGRLPVLKTALVAFVVICLLDWVLIEDFGFFGGLGTDPNSMIPMILLAAAGYLALTRPAPAEAPTPAEAPAHAETPTPTPATPAPLRPQSAFRLLASTSFRSIVAAGAVAVILLGAAPLAVAQANPNADPILAQAISGSSSTLNLPAPGFTLTDQAGHQVSLASLRGKVVLLTFLDPVCVTDCPLIGTEFAQASHLLAADSNRVEMVAVVLSPSYRSLATMRAFDQHEGLATLPNWQYLTGSLTSLKKVWVDYGMTAQVLPGGAMTGHNDETFLISQRGRVVREFNSDPGPGTTATISSYSVLFANAVRQELR